VTATSAGSSMRKGLRLDVAAAESEEKRFMQDQKGKGQRCKDSQILPQKRSTITVLRQYHLNS